MKVQMLLLQNITTVTTSFLICIMLLLCIGCSSAIRFSSSAASGNSFENISKTGANPQIKRETPTTLLFPNDAPSLTEKQQTILAKAKQFLGVSYCYGGNGPQCIDCSGFVAQVFAATGCVLPRTAQQQSLIGTAINPNEAVPGDLIFFSFDNRSVEHVGIYAGNGSIIHASKSKGVVLQRLDTSGLLSGLHSIRRIAGIM